MRNSIKLTYMPSIIIQYHKNIEADVSPICWILGTLVIKLLHLVVPIVLANREEK